MQRACADAKGSKRQMQTADRQGMRGQHCTLLPVAPSSSRKTMDSAKVASFTYGSAHEHNASCHFQVNC